MRPPVHNRPGAVGFNVTATYDGTDLAPGDGSCSTLLSRQECTLRAAIQEANALAGPDYRR